MLKKCPTNFLFFDVETAGFTEHVRLFNAFHCERIKKRRGGYEWHTRDHITAVSIYQLLDGLLVAGVQNARVYAHNSGFDVRYLINELKRAKIPHVASVQMNGSVMLSGKLYISNYAGKAIMLEFRDSMRLAPMSLEAFAKSFCPDYPKLDAPDFDNCETAELIPYCKRDCEILYHGLQTFAAEMGTKLERLPLTIPSLAFNRLRKIGDAIHDVPANSGLTRRWNDELRNYYFGGRIFIAEGVKSSSKYDVVSLDITSSYPAQMCKYDYPTNVAPDYYVNPTSLPKDGRYLAKIRITDYNPALPVLPYRQSNGAVTYPRGTFTAYVSDLELQFLVNKQCGQYKTLEVLELLHWKPEHCKAWLREYVEESYKVKLKGDELNKQEKGGGDLYRTIGKLLLNSAYGKFAEKYHDTEGNILYTGHDCEDTTEVEYDSDTEETRDRRNVAIAAMITAAGRIQLAEMIDYYGASNVIYCDTDSVKIVKSVYDTTPRHPLINDDLGGWKYEGLYTDFSVIAPKVYFGLHDGKPELKAKGVRVSKSGNIKFCSTLYADNVKISNNYAAITDALANGKRVTAFFDAQPTQMRTYLKTGDISAESMRSFTQPQNVTGFDYDGDRGYSFKIVKNGD